MEKYIYIIILNYKNWKDTIECIEAVSKSNYKKLKLLVVDNYSENESVEEIINYIQTSELINRTDYSLTVLKNKERPLEFGNDLITVIESDKNGGFAYGNNLAIDLIKNESGYVFLLNPDMIVTPDSIGFLLKSQKGLPDKNISSCRIFDYYNREKLLYSGLVRLNPKTATIKELMEINREGDYVCGGALFTSTKTFKDVGLLPEEYFLYWEDADWCYHAKQKGYTLTSSEDAISFDKGGTTIGRGYLAEYYYTRNGLIFFEKINYPTWTIVLSNFTIRLIKKILLLQFSRAKALIDGTLAFLLKKY
jgi:GT2 family glycosyltransferase